MRPLRAARPLALESLYANMRAKRWICASAARLGEAAGHGATAACPRYLYITLFWVLKLGLGLLVSHMPLAIIGAADKKARVARLYDRGT